MSCALTRVVSFNSGGSLASSTSKSEPSVIKAWCCPLYQVMDFVRWTYMYFRNISLCPENLRYGLLSNKLQV